MSSLHLTPSFTFALLSGPDGALRRRGGSRDSARVQAGFIVCISVLSCGAAGNRSRGDGDLSFGEGSRGAQVMLPLETLWSPHPAWSFLHPMSSDVGLVLQFRALHSERNQVLPKRLQMTVRTGEKLMSKVARVVCLRPESCHIRYRGDEDHYVHNLELFLFLSNSFTDAMVQHITAWESNNPRGLYFQLTRSCSKTSWHFLARLSAHLVISTSAFFGNTTYRLNLIVFSVNCLNTTVSPGIPAFYRIFRPSARICRLGRHTVYAMNLHRTSVFPKSSPSN